jgi:hypothetical protein
MPRPNKIAVFLVIPIAALIWLAGWVMVYFGSKQETIKPRIFKQSDITIGVLPLEQEYLPEIHS